MLHTAVGTHVQSHIESLMLLHHGLTNLSSHYADTDQLCGQLAMNVVFCQDNIDIHMFYRIKLGGNLCPREIAKHWHNLPQLCSRKPFAWLNLAPWLPQWNPKCSWDAADLLKVAPAATSQDKAALNSQSAQAFKECSLPMHKVVASPALSQVTAKPCLTCIACIQTGYKLSQPSCKMTERGH